MKWCSFRNCNLVCIAGYCIHFGFNIVITHPEIMGKWILSVIYILAGYQLMGNHQCVCDLYEILLIIIIISLGQILLSYNANTSRTHSHTLPSLFGLSLFDGSVAPNRDGVNAPFRRRSMAGHCFIQINSRGDDLVFATVLVFAVFLGRTETSTRERKCFQAIRTV